MATVIQQPGFGDEIRRGLAPLLQALQFHSQRKLEQARLETDQLRAAQQISESRAREAEIRGGLEQTQRIAKGEADATKVFQEVLDSVGNDADQLTQEMLTGALSKLKTPEAVAAFQKMWPGYQASIDSLFNIQQTGREAEVAPLAQEIRMKALTAARDLLLDPNAKMPTDPTMMQAVGMQQLEILGFVETKIRVAAQQADANAQADMLARQTAMEAYRAGIDEWQTTLDNHGGPAGLMEALKDDAKKEPEERVFGGATTPTQVQAMILDRTARMMLGIGLEDLRKVTGDNIRKFGGLSSAEEQGLTDIGFVSQRLLRQLPPRLQTMIASDFPADEQTILLQTVSDILAGRGQKPSVEALAPFFSDPSKASRIINAAVTKLAPTRTPKTAPGERQPSDFPESFGEIGTRTAAAIGPILTKITEHLGTTGVTIP